MKIVPPSFGVLALLALLVLAFAAGAAFGGPRKGVFVESDTSGVRNADSLRIIVVKNPGHRPALATVWCRKDPRTSVDAMVPAHGRIVFEMASDHYLDAGDCELVR